MPLLIDLTGKRFGKLVVINRASNTAYKHVRWHVHCDCGNDKIVSGKNLKHGDSTSCGCYAREINSSVDGLASARGIYWNYFRRARKSGFPFEFSLELFFVMTSNNCYYCDISPCSKYRAKGCRDVFIYNGIDRKDNTVGYTLDNCVPCCKVCNIAKRTMTEQEFYEWISRLYTNLKATDRIKC